jgi:hypothetical protein
MRLNDFADPSDYIPTIANVEDLVRQLGKSWPHDDLELVLGVTKPATEREEVNDGL